MWSEPTKSGKVKFVERYTDPLTGKEKRVSVTMEKETARTRKEAAQILNDKIDTALHKSFCVKIEALTLSDLTDRYLSNQKSIWKASTYKRNKEFCKLLMKLLGANTRLSSLSAGYIKERITTEKAGTTNERITRLKALLRWGYENDYIDDIRFLDKIKILEDREKKEKLNKKFLEKEELQAILQGMERMQWKLLTEFLVLSGLCIGEATALRMESIDFKEKIIHIFENYDPVNEVITSTKTDNSCRDVFMQPELEKKVREIKQFTLTQCINTGIKTSFLFCDINGHPIHYYAYRKYLKNKGVTILSRTDITPHILRHTHTSLMAASGVPLEVISRRLGHGDSKITSEIYFHVTEQLRARDNEQIKKIQIL